jgi:hypothetical protein
MNSGREEIIDDSIFCLLTDVKRRTERALTTIEELRDLTYYSISDAAKERGESPLAMWRALRYWERKNPTTTTLARLADVLGVDLQWLLGGNINSIVWTRNPEASE